MVGRWWGRTIALTLVWGALAASGAEAGDGAGQQLKLEIPAGLRAAGPFGAPLGGSWLPAHQMPDGHWSARDWDRWCMRVPRQVTPRPFGRAARPYDLTVTGLALCGLISGGYSQAGSHPLSGITGRGLGWLTRRQRPNGDFALPGDPDPATGHALATLAVVEDFGMSSSDRGRVSAQRAIAHLLTQQARSGAWRNPASNTDDALATFWAALSLQSAKLINAAAVRNGREAPIDGDVTGALARITAWFGVRTDPKMGIVRAAGGSGPPESVCTAAGVLVRFYAGQDVKTNATVRAACEYLRAHPPTTDEREPEGGGLYAYIGSLAAHLAGGQVWRAWRLALGKTLVGTQNQAGQGCDRRGSWDPRGPWARERGRVAMTALAQLTLNTLYRYDRVFADEAGAWADTLATTAMAPGAAQVDVLQQRSHAGTWKRSALPTHAARLALAAGGSLPVDAVHLRAEVRGMRAQVVLDLFVTNTEKGLQEGVLDLRLPDGAAPYYLAFGAATLSQVPIPGADAVHPRDELGTSLAALRGASRGDWGSVREARMAPVAEATRAFETIVRQRLDPALLTWAGAGVFHLRVFPLEPGKQHRIVVAYEVDLVPVGDDAELHLNLPWAVHDLRVALRAPGASWSTVPDAPLHEGVRTWHEPGVDAIRVTVDRPGDTFLVGTASDGAPHTAAWIRPDVPEVERPSSERAQFLIDVSHSVDADHLQVWRTLIPAILEANRDDLTSFAVGFFDMRTTWWCDGFVANTPKNVQALREAMDALEPGGATDLAQALASVRKWAGPMDVFLFTDGVPTWGPVARRDVLARLDADHPVFAYSVGLGGEDGAALRAISAKSGGALVTVLGQMDVPSAARAHRYQPWTVEALSIPGVSDLLVAGDPRRIHPGQHLRLAGRGRPTVGENLFLRLRHGHRQSIVRVPIPEPDVSPMAARAYGQAGVRRLEAAGSGLRKLAQDYAIHYRVVRESCALVMLESEADYARFGLTETGQGRRVVARPVLSALAKAAPKPAGEERTPSLLAYARKRAVPDALLELLGALPGDGIEVPVASSPVPADATLRTLGNALERPDATGYERLLVALRARGLGLPERACATLLGSTQPDFVAEWLLGRSAAAAKRPLLALVGYEAALARTSPLGFDDVPTLWVIAADYERFLGRLQRRELTGPVRRFVHARAASLESWRSLMGDYAPPKQAALVVLELPFDRRYPTDVEVRGPNGVLEDRPVEHGGEEDPTASTPPESILRRFPAKATAVGPQMTALLTLPGTPWRVALLRPQIEQEDGAGTRALVIVIRDWGLPGERVEHVRSIGPDDDPVIMQEPR